MVIALNLDNPLERKLLDLADKLQKSFHREIDLGLERVQNLLAQISNPHLRLPPVIHVAGTNGKGSVVANLRAMMESAGYAAHVYTSPHLVEFNERIRIGGSLIEDDYFLELIEDIMPIADAHPVTFFELLTVTAFQAFADNPADVLILEVGMGGRLDATNVVENPVATVITPVSMDHTEFLGDTIEKIALEKAAIQKPNAPSIVSMQQNDAMDAIAGYARRIGAPIFRFGQEWRVQSTAHGMHYSGEKWDLDLPRPKLIGAHQIGNSGAAIAALEQLHGFEFSADAIADGLLRLEWPARMQRLQSGPAFEFLSPGDELWLDGGHNPGAGLIIASAIRDWKSAAPNMPVVAIIGMLKNKDAAGFMEPLAGLVDAVHCVPIKTHAQSALPEDLEKCAARFGIPGMIQSDVVDAVKHIKKTRSQPARVLICGSLYLAGEVLKLHR